MFPSFKTKSTTKQTNTQTRGQITQAEKTEECTDLSSLGPVRGKYVFIFIFFFFKGDDGERGDGIKAILPCPTKESNNNKKKKKKTIISNMT